MNKAQLLSALQADFYFVDTPALQATIGRLRRYAVRFFDRSGDNLELRNTEFFVEDEGQAGELAFWSSRQPKPGGGNAFLVAVQAYIASKIADNTMEAAFYTSVDEVSETAIAWAYILLAGKWNEEKILIQRSSPGGPLLHIVLDSVKRTGD